MFAFIYLFISFASIYLFIYSISMQ